jgi:hypothetical protein
MLRPSRLSLACRLQTETLMTQPQTPLSIPDCAPAMLTLPDPLTLDSISRLEDALASLFRTLRKDLRGNAADDPGSIEVDSWAIPLH